MQQATLGLRQIVDGQGFLGLFQQHAGFHRLNAERLWAARRVCGRLLLIDGRAGVVAVVVGGTSEASVGTGLELAFRAI